MVTVNADLDRVHHFAAQLLLDVIMNFIGGLLRGFCWSPCGATTVPGGNSQKKLLIL